MNTVKRLFDTSKIKGIVFDKDGTLLDFSLYLGAKGACRSNDCGRWRPKACVNYAARNRL